MKRSAAILLMSALALGSAMTANADAQVTKTGTVENADLIYGTSLLRVEGSGGYAMANLEGTALTGSIYSSSFSASDGYIIANEAGDSLDTRGAFSPDGKIVVPFQYSEVQVLNNHWALGFMLQEATGDQYDFTSWLDSDVFYLISSVDVYYLDGSTGTSVASLTRDQYIDADAFGPYINIQDRSTNAITTYDSQFQAVAADVSSTYDETIPYQDRVTFRENGQEGLQDADGNVVMEPAFQYIESFYGDYARVSTGETYGLIDKDGNVIVPAEYEKIESCYSLPADAEGNTSGYVANGFVAVVQDGKVGFVDQTGTLTCAPKYAEAALEMNGASALMTDMEGKQYIIAADGVETLIEGYDNISAMNYGSGMYYEVRNADYQEGMIDWHGNVIFPCEYESIELSADGNHVLVSSDYYTQDIYEISYEMDAAAGGTEAGAEAGAEVGAAEAPAEEGDSNSAVTAVIDSAIALVSADATANSSAISTLLQQAKGMLSEEQASAATILNQAIALLEGEAVDADAVNALLNSVKSLL